MSATTLPVLTFNEVKEVHRWPGSVVLVAPVPWRRGRYHVIRLFLESGRALVIGRELPLPLARAVAKRDPLHDGKPVTGRRSWGLS